MFNDVAYVAANGNDTLGRVGNSGKPFLTMTAAIQALPSTGGTLRLVGFGPFDSASQTVLSSKPLTIIGSGRPFPNWSIQQLNNNAISFSSPTKLDGGTVIRGEMAFINVTKGPRMYNLGIDVGSDFVTAGGTAGNGIAVYQSNSDESSTTNLTPFPLSSGVEIKNVTTLCSNPDAPYHGVVLQGTFSPFIEDVTTIHGVHGMAIKTTAGKFRNITLVNHGQNGIIVKTNTYSKAHKNVIDGFHTYGCLYGVTIQNRDIIPMRDLTLSNGFIEGGTAGVRTVDDAVSGTAQGFQGLAMTGVKVRNATTSFSLSGHTQSSARNCWNGATLYEFQN